MMKKNPLYLLYSFHINCSHCPPGQLYDEEKSFVFVIQFSGIDNDALYLRIIVIPCN